MAKIEDYQELIQGLHPQEQEILVGRQPSAKWQEHINANNDVRQVFDALRRDNQNRMVITREEVFNAATPEEKIIKALIWGYPGGMQGTANLRNIIAHLADISQILTRYPENQALLQQTFIAMYNCLTSITGLKQSTASKLLYFFNIQVGQNRALVVDENVYAAFQAFEDFIKVSWEVEVVKRYLKQLMKMNSLAHSLDVQPDQLELFLFEFGKCWRNNNNGFVQQCINSMNQQ